jgi:signal transduction histidine kinase
MPAVWASDSGGRGDARALRRASIEGPGNARARGIQMGKEGEVRLADFLDANVERILKEWEPFAASLLPAGGRMDSLALRDHATEIVQAIAADLRNPQTTSQQDLKARGLAPQIAAAPHTAAQTHATLRAASGFTAQQLVAEYRALRARVLRLWLSGVTSIDQEVVDDIGRFNEAIDQAVAESVDHFTREVDRWRNVFLGVLGHEMRGPLDAILLTTQLLERIPEGVPVSKHTARMIRSGQRMKRLLDDLLDFNRSALGFGIAVKPEFIDMAHACSEEIELRRLAAPSVQFVMETEGDTQGEWDAERVRQLLGNLLSNALKYGDGVSPVVVRLVGRTDDVVLSVTNSGPSLPNDRPDQLFEPLRRERSTNYDAERTSLGLGLYIVKAVARAHGASVGAESADGKTVFTVRWPKHAA